MIDNGLLDYFKNHADSKGRLNIEEMESSSLIKKAYSQIINAHHQKASVIDNTSYYDGEGGGEMGYRNSSYCAKSSFNIWRNHEIFQENERF